MSVPIFGSFRRFGTALLAALAVCIVPVGTAHAQFLFGPQYSSSLGNQVSFGHKHGHGNYHSVQRPARQSQFRSGTRKGTVIAVSFRHKHRLEHDNLVSFRHKGQHRHAKSELAKKAEPQDAVKTELAKKYSPKGPLQIIISIADQRISLYDNGALIARSSVSTGVQGHPTPLGIFTVISKERWHRSNIYSGAPMPYMQRITWSGIALHSGVVPGHPASHGCIRLPNDFAIRLWRLTKRGTRVITAREDVQPVEIANPHLFVSKPKAASVSPESSAVTVAGNNNNIAPATHGALLSNAGTPEVTDLQIPRSIPAGAEPQKVGPISVFVSRKLSRLFVRQGFTPLFDVPVKIENPEQPLGTQVFTAMDYQSDGASIRWTVVSLPEEFSRTKERETVATPPSVMLPDKANEALGRIEIPREAIEQISQLMTPGSSLIISDYGISHETGNDTDFIVVMH